jgi:paraquat-inducible protein B
MKEFGEASVRGGVRPPRGSDELPRARASRRRWQFPTVWLVPLFAALLAGYLVYDRVHEFGPQNTIQFSDASGIRTGQTLVKYRGVPVGEVTAIELGPDLQRALVEVRLQRSAATIATKGSVFWIVRPKVGWRNITGLSTFITGPEIGVRPGTGPQATEFVGVDDAPVTAGSKG